VVKVNQRNHITKGYIFTKGQARQARIVDFEDEFINRLEGLSMIMSSYFKPGSDIAAAYRLFRSLRQGSNTEAIWNKVETRCYGG
jgi:hypothetical protein